MSWRAADCLNSVSEDMNVLELINLICMLVKDTADDFWSNSKPSSLYNLLWMKRRGESVLRPMEEKLIVTRLQRKKFLDASQFFEELQQKMEGSLFDG